MTTTRLLRLMSLLGLALLWACATMTAQNDREAGAPPPAKVIETIEHRDGSSATAPKDLETIEHPDVSPGDHLKLVGAYNDRPDERPWTGEDHQTAAISADGELIAAATTTIELIDRQSRTVLATLPGHQKVFDPIHHLPPRGVEHLLFADDDSALISVGRYDRTIKLWDLDSGQMRWETEIEGDCDSRDRMPVRRIGLTGDGQYVFLLGGILPTGATGFVSFYALDDGSEVERLERADLGLLGAGVIGSVDLCPKGKYLALSLSSGTRVQTTAGAEVLWQWQPGREARFSADGQSLIALTPRSSIVAYDLKTGELIAQHQAPDSRYDHSRQLAVATDNHRSLGASQAVALWDHEHDSYEIIGEAVSNDAPSARIRLVSIAANGRYGVTSSVTRGIQVWDLNDGREDRLETPEAMISGVHVAADGTKLLSYGPRGEVLLWDIESRHPTPLTEGSRFLVSADVSRDRSQAAILTLDKPGGSDIELTIIDLEAEAVVAQLFDHLSDHQFITAPNLVALSPSGDRAVISHGRFCAAIPIDNPSQYERFDNCGRPADIAVIGDARLLTLDRPSKSLSLRNRDGTIEEWFQDENILRSFAISADERLAFVGDTAGQLHLVDLERQEVLWTGGEEPKPQDPFIEHSLYDKEPRYPGAGKPTAPTPEPPQPILDTAISSDGSLAVAIDTQLLQVFDGPTGNLVDRIEIQSPTSVTVSPDAIFIYVGTASGDILRFYVPPTESPPTE